MKHHLLIVTIAAVAVAMGYMSPYNAARAWEGNGCTLASVAGTFGFSYSGVGILPTGPVPVAAVGNFRTNNAGVFTGTEVNSIGGNATDQTILGNLTVNNDCSGTLIAKVFENGVLVRTSYIHLQYENNASEIAGIFQKLVLPNGTSLPVVITIAGKRLFHERGD